MKKAGKPRSPGPVRVSLERLPGYLTVKEAAGVMGVSERSVYHYVEAGKLSGARFGQALVLYEEEVERFERRAPGRVRTRTPRWHVPPRRNLQYITMIEVRIQSGRREALERKIEQIRVEKKHLLPGTSARYILHGRDDPDVVQIVLVWRQVVMPPVEEREASLSAFAVDLADVLNWETAVRHEGQVLLHAYE